MLPATEKTTEFIHGLPGGCGLIIFDGACILCSYTVGLLLKSDRSRKLRFTTLQSVNPEIHSLIACQSISSPDSVLLLSEGKIYTESQALLEIAGLMGGGWKLLLAGYLIPAFIRNKAYRFVARNRYRWFGRRLNCFVPREEDKNRFIT